jgi:myosin heavy subunit
MDDMEKLSRNIVDLSKSTKDSNKFYSIVLDAAASTISENTCDIAERLLRGETDNAKAALEHLWSLKKIMISKHEAATIEQLIRYYQKKMDVVRNKEEHIKRVSKDSRGLLEEKRKRDVELATIRQEITNSSKEIKELEEKVEKYKNKEQELTTIDAQVQKELLVNENEIINGLYEIIMSQREGRNPVDDFAQKLKGRAAAAPQKKPAGVSASAPEKAASNVPAAAPGKTEAAPPDRPAASAEPDVADIPVNEEIFEVDKDKTTSFSFEMLAKARNGNDAIKSAKDSGAPQFPKSIVKTAKGSVIGEYYYSAKMPKDKRQYVLSSKFFLDRLSSALGVLSVRQDQTIANDLLQMIRDAVKRISGSATMHFETSTADVLNEQAARDLWHDVKTGDYAEATRYCSKLAGKLAALKPKYAALLEEQMGRYAAV